MTGIFLLTQKKWERMFLEMLICANSHNPSVPVWDFYGFLDIPKQIKNACSICM